jgi:putative glycosyltransferase (TIGR04372 family)
LEKILGYKVQKHEYRDSEVSSYLKAAYVLAEMGYTVFRMGAAVKEPLHSRHPLVIDYASNGMRTEFLDVFLGAHCKFCISTGSGWDNIPTIFGKKKLLVNHLPVFGPDAVTASHIIYPKILRDIKSGSTLGISELIERNIQSALRTKSYESAGVEIINLSEEEIVDAVIEMAQRVEGTFVETEFQSAIQDKLRHILSVHPRLKPSPGFYPIRATYASCFLNRYPNFLPD